MAVVRVTRRYLGVLSVLALVGLILLVGPPDRSSSSSDPYANIDLSPPLATDVIAPDRTKLAANGLHRLDVGVWASGATIRDLPMLEVRGQDASSAARDNDILEAAVEHRATQLRTSGATISTTSRIVFGELPGVELHATDGGVEQVTWLAAYRHALYTATVYARRDQSRAADALLDTLRFAP